MRVIEISLSKNDLEHIANGYNLRIKVGSRSRSEVDEIILKPALVNDLINPLINYKHKIINTEQQNIVNTFMRGAR